MNERERFYRERDRRSVEYGLAEALFEHPVSLIVGKEAAKCARGQQAVLALANMIARVHRTIGLEIPSVPLIAPTIVRATRLDDAAASLARAIDPYVRLESARAEGATIGLGADAPRGLNWYAGATGQTALLTAEPQAFDHANGPSLGAGLSACLAASALMRQLIGDTILPARVSAWHLRDNPQTAYEPDELWPLDVGTVMMVGGGGVGSAVAYWLREFGIRGRWIVLDGDRAELHNTNRSIGIFPSDAGWPSGEARNKAEIAAGLFGAEAAPVWYDQFDHDSVRPDLVLPLANEREVRHLIACRGEPILLHATTSLAWEAQLHRHIPGRDDCITCRLPQAPAQDLFRCSTGEVRIAEGRTTDAALPFLSACAGLMVLASLFRLQFGEFSEGQHNAWAVSFRGARAYTRRAICTCRDGCAVTLSPAARAQVHIGTRWSSLDEGK